MVKTYYTITERHVQDPNEPDHGPRYTVGIVTERALLGAATTHGIEPESAQRAVAILNARSRHASMQAYDIDSGGEIVAFIEEARRVGLERESLDLLSEEE